MTRMLIKIATSEDAAIAAAGFCDIVEVTPATVDATTLGAIRAAFPGTLRLRLDQAAAIDAALACAPDEIALPHAAIHEAAARLKAAGPQQRPITLAAIVSAAEAARVPLGALAGPAGFVVLDAGGARLIDGLSMAELDAFAQACRAAGLPFGLAGRLEAPDVARLLVLRPDMLGFDVALRRDHRADRGLDGKAIEAIRALIPCGPHGRDGGVFDQGGETDHIFVHDFVAHLSIGAYQAERGVRQRVRFSVDADVRRPAEPPTDMRGVFSYDIIIETIRVLASRAHVTFVETLAEELAATLLAYPKVSTVTVKVEKLDVIEGAVGIIITRDRRTAAKPLGGS